MEGVVWNPNWVVSCIALELVGWKPSLGVCWHVGIKTNFVAFVLEFP